MFGTSGPFGKVEANVTTDSSVSSSSIKKV